MRTILLFMLCTLIIGHAAHSQDNLLPPVMRNSKNEYSGMCMYDGKIFLLPQSKKPGTPFSGYIQSIDTSKIWLDKDLKVHVPDAALCTYTFSNLQEIAKKIPGFEGFEAIVIANNTVFLTVETETDTDYLIRGYLHDSVITLIANLDMALPKPLKNGIHLTNAGLEGLTFYKGQLLVAFEYNYFGPDTKVYLVDTGFKTLPGLRSLTEAPFRLTDICDNGHGSYYAINHYWNFAGNSNHKEAYYKDIDASKDPDLKHWMWNECFTRIIDIRSTPNRFTWETKMVIPNRDCINWEGIVPYRDGVLLISDDNKIPFLETKFRYYPLQ